MGRGGEFTGAGRSVIGAGFALPRVPTGGRRSLACAPLCPVGARRNCIFTARGGGECTLAGRSVMRAGFALPRDAGRRPALLSCASRDGMWCGIHVGRAQRHEGWFRAPARCRSETGAPWPARRSARWGLGATAFSQQDVVWHSRGQGVASRALVSRSRAMPVGDRRSLACGAAPLGGGSVQLHFHSKRWCATYGGRAQCHEGWFRAPARCRSETGAPLFLARQYAVSRPGAPRCWRPLHSRLVSSRAQVRSGSVMTSTRAGPSLASAVRRASVNCSARSTRMPRPPQSVA